MIAAPSCVFVNIAVRERAGHMCVFTHRNTMYTHALLMLVASVALAVQRWRTSVCLMALPGDTDASPVVGDMIRTGMTSLIKQANAQTYVTHKAASDVERLKNCVSFSRSVNRLKPNIRRYPN